MRRVTVLSLSARSLAHQHRTPRPCFVAQWLQARNLSYSPGLSQLQAESPSNEAEAAIPLRKHLKDEKKRKKADKGKAEFKRSDGNKRYGLTVGLEIHAELNSPTKLFSSARTDDPPTQGDIPNSSPSTAPANTKVSPFDAALPGTQPHFQPPTLLPALRAALALNCTINPKSTWDRKHYFHWDQPNGYQITQFYSPFAVNGSLVLTAEDGVPKSDLNDSGELVIGIKQVQMEQDTAKTIHHPPNTYHVDLNRAGHPLIEIITLPQIHSAKAAAAVVRKIVGILKCVDACVVGMEAGGLRADVNVSMKQRGSEEGGLAYGGVEGLGQRTEIKNLASFKAVEDAIGAEMQRQIRVLEEGGVVEGETRGWTLGATETTRLRGKEGEVDYRYMPDPDLPPLFIGEDLVKHLKKTLPELPEMTVERLQENYGMSSKDARSLLVLDDGDRLEFMEETVELILQKGRDPVVFDTRITGKMVGNWVLHEIGGLLTTTETTWAQMQITPDELSDITCNILQKEITPRVGKQLLATLHDIPKNETRRTVDELIDRGNLRLRPLSEEEYLALAEKLISEHPDIVAAIREKGQKSKVMWLVGQMLRQAEEGTVEPGKAREILEKLFAG